MGDRTLGNAQDGMSEGEMRELLILLRRENETLKLSQRPQASQEPAISLPNKFYGKKEDCRNFINQVKMIFELQPSKFTTDRGKICFIGTLLSGAASTWFTPLFEEDSYLLTDLGAFLEEMELNFGDFDRETTAANQLQVLKQGNRSASEYAAEFRRICSDLSWGEGAFVDYFRRGLSEEIKDSMLTLPVPTTLHEATQAAVRCDERIRERRNDRRGGYAWRSNSRSTQGPTPMEIDAIREATTRAVSAEERARRRDENLCFYCGKTGHLLRNCQARRGSQGNGQVRP